MASTWGDPNSGSFEKKNIRQARASGHVAQVNIRLVALMSRLIAELTDLHVDVPASVPSYDVGGTDGQRLGLSILIPGVEPTPELGQLVTRWGFDGFPLDDGRVEIRFIGTPEEGENLNDEAIAERLDALDSDDVSGPNPSHWPGSRNLELGDTGQDAMFLRLLFNAGSPEDPVGPDLFVALRSFQDRRGVPPHERWDPDAPVVDENLWRRILPAGRPYVGQGDSGFNVRVLQAALVAYEGATTRVTGTWGVLTSRDVTALQKHYSLRAAQFVRAPEWAVVLGPENERITAARAAAAKSESTSAL